MGGQGLKSYWQSAQYNMNEVLCAKIKEETMLVKITVTYYYNADSIETAEDEFREELSELYGWPGELDDIRVEKP